MPPEKDQSTIDVTQLKGSANTLYSNVPTSLDSSATRVRAIVDALLATQQTTATDITDLQRRYQLLQPGETTTFPIHTDNPEQLIQDLWQSGFVNVSIQPTDSHEKTMTVSGTRPLEMQDAEQRKKIWEMHGCISDADTVTKLSGGVLNFVCLTATQSGPKILKQGTKGTAAAHLSPHMKTMSPERIADETTSMQALRDLAETIGVRIPRVHAFDAPNNLIVMENIGEGGQMLSKVETWPAHGTAWLSTLGEFLATQHNHFERHPLFIRGTPERDRRKWEWVFRLRSTEIAKVQEKFDPHLKAAIETKAETILREHLVPTLVNPDVIPKNIFVYGKEAPVGLIDFEFSSGVGDPLYDLGFLLGHVIIMGKFQVKFNIETETRACLEAYDNIRAIGKRMPDVAWYAACAIFYRWAGASQAFDFSSPTAQDLVAAAKQVAESGGDDIARLFPQK